MTEKKYTIMEYGNFLYIAENDKQITGYFDSYQKEDLIKIVDLLNEQEKEIKELESENKMLKITIGRNESYIKRLITKGKWSNTGDVE